MNNKMKNYEILLIFDLDFTLIDNSEGIINSFNHALTKHGYQALPIEEISPLIGVPLELMFLKYVDIDVNVLIKSFRDYYSKKGIFQLSILPGAREKIVELKKLGYSLAVLTSKKEELARVLVKNIKLDRYFDIVWGSTEDRKLKNSPLLKQLLKKEFENFGKYCMIGDHQSDGEVSELLKCPFVGLLTGKSSKGDLLSSTSMKTVILNSIKEINPKIIDSLFN